MRLRFVPKPLLQQLRAVDWIGSVLFIASTTSFLLGLTWGGVLYPWNSYQALVPLILGALGCVAFAFYEAYLANNPIIPLVLFHNRTTVVSYFGTVITGLVLWCILYYMPLYFEAVQGYSPVIAGVALFPQTFTVAPAGALAGALITKTGKYRWSIWLGWTLGTLGLGLFCVLNVDTSIPAWIFLNLVSGLGLGFLFPAIATAIQASVASENVAMAIAMFSFFRSAGQALGVAVGGVIFQNRMYANLLGYPNLAPFADSYSANAVGLIEIIRLMPEGTDKHDLKQAYADSLRIVWAVCCALGGVAFITSLLTRHHSLDQALVTDQSLVESKRGRSGKGEDVSPEEAAST
jgi:MFS family permease